MAYEFLDLEESLRKYPTLRQSLGQSWIEREKAISPLESTFPLARILRIAELEGLIGALERRLKNLETVPGAKDWRTRLRMDGPAHRELQTEIAFADLLLRSGFSFEHPREGPDFSVYLEPDMPLLIEVTTPRVIAWDDDLTTRLWILSRKYSHSFRTEPLKHDSPIRSEDVGELRVKRIVSEAINLLESGSSKESGLVQIYPDLGLRIEWTRSESPRYTGRNAPHSSHHRAFAYVRDAAERKAGQLRSSDAQTLLIGTNQLSFDWLPYIHSIRRRVPYYGDFDWSQIDSQVNFLILFEASYGDSRVPAVDYLIRPGSGYDSNEDLLPFLSFLKKCGEDYVRQEADDDRVLVARLEARSSKATHDEGSV